ncbi:hypothetical protein [uncultured Methanobrevibacter sp.]|uniref:hypothetical protein n=1 Tax=uncultured Methanobrevibacter sp. TaxID=253161 RepID=UPI00261F27DA|nr:hypothetical protein [uncultured Methanobrevibacter sp.]
MAIEGYFFNALENEGVYDRIYNAEDVTSYLDKLVGNGVFPNPSTQLQVRASSGMNVIVGAGSGWINGHKMINTSDMTVTLTSSDAILNRIDAVIFYVDFDQREMGISVKTGTLASVPVAPVLTRNNNRYEMCLAQITVNKQITEITAAMIKDTRGDSNLCGYVQGLIQQVDTSTLWTQQQEKFDEWFDGVQGQFEAGKLFKKLEGIHVTTQENEASFNVLNYVPSYSFAYDILEIFINGFHLNSNEYTLSNNTVTLEMPISTAGAVVDFVVYKSVDPDA